MGAVMAVFSHVPGFAETVSDQNLESLMVELMPHDGSNLGQLWLQPEPTPRSCEALAENSLCS